MLPWATSSDLDAAFSVSGSPESAQMYVAGYAT